MKPIQNFITKSSLIVGSFSLLAVTAHLFFRMIEHAPYVSTDDGLANVAVALSETGRYAFLTSPINFGLLRDETFFNFGPIYFYAGSLLTWLFDSPLVMMRALHPASLAVVTVLAFYVFGPTSRAAVLLLAIALFQLFWSVQWPMVRK